MATSPSKTLKIEGSINLEESRRGSKIPPRFKDRL